MPNPNRQREEDIGRPAIPGTTEKIKFTHPIGTPLSEDVVAALGQKLHQLAAFDNREGEKHASESLFTVLDVIAPFFFKGYNDPRTFMWLRAILPKSFDDNKVN